MSTPPLRVLLVDADPDTVTRTRTLLADSSSGCELVVAKSVSEAIDLLLHADFGAVLVSHRSGSTTAVDLLGGIRPAGGTTPVIVITEDFDAEVDEQAGATGIDDYLCYDELSPRILLRSIRQATRRIRIERERDQLLELVQYESDFLESLITGIPGVVWERRGGEDPLSHRITFMSDYIETMIGFTSRELRMMREKWAERVHPDDREEVRATILAHEPPGSYHFTYRIFARDGRIVWVASNVVTSIADNGEIVERGISLDITEQRRAEEALRVSEERFRVAIKASSMAVFSMDRELRYTWAYNTSFAPIASIIGSRDIDLVDERTAAVATRIKREVLDTGIGIHEEIMVDNRGVRQYFDMVIEPLFDRHGEVAGITGATFDLTSIRSAEEELRISQERFQLAMRATNDVIWDWDLSDGAFWMSENAATVFGYPPGEIRTGIEWRMERIDPDQRDAVHAAIMHAIARGETFWSAEYRFIRGNGSLANVLDRGYIVHDAEGKPVRMLGAMIDITERVHAEQLLQEANDQLERRVEERTAEIVRVVRRLEQTNLVQKRFIADASHDLRTPLTVLRAELDLLRRGTDDPKLLSSLAGLSREAQRLDTLITDLLVLATLEGRGAKPGRQPIRIDEMILEGASRLGPLAAERRIIWRIISEEPVEITGDEMMIKRMLANLMENAVKYSREEGIVEVSLTHIPRSAERSEQVEIIIRDNGAGIAEQDLPRVFDRFYRGDITRSTPGTGLGLAIVKAAVDAHGGEVTIDSTVDVGTTVTLRLDTDARTAGDNA